MNIAVVLYDNLPEDCKDIRDNLRDLTYFKTTHGPDKYDVYDSNNITVTLRSLNKYDWAVVICIGTFLSLQKLIRNTVDWAIENKTPLCGQIIDYGNYPHFHEQWFAIDLNVYRELGSLPLEPQKIDKVTYRAVIRSKENIHDSHTPLWVQPTIGTIQYENKTQEFGEQLLAKVIEAGYKVVNIPSIVRQKKMYPYPQYNAMDIRTLIECLSTKPYKRFPYHWDLEKQTSFPRFAKAFKDIADKTQKGYYALNTEEMIINKTDKVFDCFIGVSAGVKPACIVSTYNFKPNSKIYIFDFNDVALLWQQYLLKEWDGEYESFTTVFNKFKEQYPDYIPLGVYNEYISDNLKRFGITKEHWIKYKSMQHTFIKLNLLDDSAAKQIAEIANTSQGVYIWTSNAFQMEYLYFLKTIKWCNEKANNFINDLSKYCKVPYILENE
jgi:hypothetical protein